MLLGLEQLAPRIACVVLTAIFTLTFGVFNSILKAKYHVIWIGLVFSIVIIALLVVQAISLFGRTKGPLEPEVGQTGSRVYVPLVFFYLALIVISWGFHHFALSSLPASEFVNVQGVPVFGWILMNLKFCFHYLFFPILFLLHCLFLRRLDFRVFMKTTLVFVAISILVQLYQAHLNPGFLVKWQSLSVPKMDGLSTDPNAHAMLVFLVFPFALIGLLREKRKSAKAAYTVSLPLLFYSLYLTSCRSGLAALLLLIVAIPLIIGISDTTIPKRLRLLLMALPALLLTFAAVGTPLLVSIVRNLNPGGTAERLANTYTLIESLGWKEWFKSTEYRYMLLSNAWSLFVSAPWGGSGPGGYYREFSNILYQKSGEIISIDHFLDSSLNHYLMIADNFGVGVLLVNLLLILLPTYFLIKCFRRSRDVGARTAFATLAATLIIFLFYISVMPPSYFPEINWVWTGILAFALRSYREMGFRPSIGRNSLTLIGPILALAILLPFFSETYSQTFGAYGYAARLTAPWWPSSRYKELGFSRVVKSFGGLKMRATRKTTVSRIRAPADRFSFDVVNWNPKREAQDLSLAVFVDDRLVGERRLPYGRRRRISFHITGIRDRWIYLRTELARVSMRDERSREPAEEDLGIWMSRLRFFNR